MSTACHVLLRARRPSSRHPPGRAARAQRGPGPARSTRRGTASCHGRRQRQRSETRLVSSRAGAWPIQPWPLRPSLPAQGCPRRAAAQRPRRTLHLQALRAPLRHHPVAASAVLVRVRAPSDRHPVPAYCRLLFAPKMRRDVTVRGASTWRPPPCCSANPPPPPPPLRPSTGPRQHAGVCIVRGMGTEPASVGRFGPRPWRVTAARWGGPVDDGRR